MVPDVFEILEVELAIQRLVDPTLSFEVGFKVQGSGFRVQGSGCRVQGSGSKVQSSEFTVHSSGFRCQGVVSS